MRDTSVDGVAVSLGDYIALLDDQLVITAQSPEAALERAVVLAGVKSDSILTVLSRRGRRPGRRRSLRLCPGIPGAGHSG